MVSKTKKQTPAATEDYFNAEPEHGSLGTRAMLVDLSISQWHSRKKDEKITREVATRHNTSKEAGNYRKNLLHQVTAPAWEAITSIINEARNFHRTHTLPWSDGGGELRILPATEHLEYVTFFRKLGERFNEAVPVFAREAMKPGGYFDQAQKNLNGMANPADYPANQAQLEAQFKLTTKRWPLPSTADFRVELGEEQLAEVRKQMEHDLKQVEAAAMKEVWSRAYETVKHSVEILGENGGRRTKKTAKGKAKTTTAPARVTQAFFDNLKEQCALLPRLNLANDPNLAQMIKELDAKVADCDPSFIRKSKTTRKSVADDAASIMDKMKAFMPQD